MQAFARPTIGHPISINRGLLIWQQGLLQDSNTIDRLHLLIHLMRLPLLA